MGQYWMPVNIDKREFIDPHRLGTGLKLWEQLANHPGTGAALIVLQAAMPGVRGGGDLDKDRDDVCRRTIGRWAGDRVVLVGDYREAGDVPGWDADPAEMYPTEEDDDGNPLSEWTDISDDVCHVIAAELDGRYEGSGWRDFYRRGEPTYQERREVYDALGVEADRLAATSPEGEAVLRRAANMVL